MDARVKSYIDLLIDNSYNVSVISLKESKQDVMRAEEKGFVNYRVATRYIGSNLKDYIAFYLAFFFKSMIVSIYLSSLHKYNVVHYNNLPNFPIFAAWLARLRGAKIILDNHDLITVMFASKFRRNENCSIGMFLVRLEQRVSMAFADIVITADHNQRDALIAEGVDKNKIKVLLNLANENYFKPDPKKRDDTEFRVVYHGTIAERLGIDIAIRAIGIAVNRVPNLKFYLIGSGDFLDNCIALIEELNLQDIVIPSQCFIPVEELTCILNTMDIGLVPNRKTPATNSYMLPVKLLEYVYMQIPVIAPRLDIIQRYFDERMLAYFEPGNPEDLARCIIELYRDTDYRENQVKQALHFFKRYNWRKQSQQYLDIIERK